jgi:hypothetical protein
VGPTEMTALPNWQVMVYLRINKICSRVVTDLGDHQDF